MDRCTEKQVQIDRRRDEICARYPALWSKIIAEWHSPGPEDRAWLMYSANYLFRTGNVRWAIDPLTLNWRVGEAPIPDAARDLSNLSFVLLTHRHADHLDLNLLSALRGLPIVWVVPEFILPTVIRRSGLQRENIIVPVHLEPIELNGINILPFDGLHWETTPDGRRKGVPSLGYLIEYKGKHCLFPGDTRTYDASQLPGSARVDCLFAHLWLGRGSALMDEPPLLGAFCRFCLDLQPRQIILSHLEELGRASNDYWDGKHAWDVCSELQRTSAHASVYPAFMGDSVLL